MNISFVSSISILILTCFCVCSTGIQTNRETLEVVINADIAPAVETLLSFADLRLASVFPVIQKFKSVISSDPFNITQTWVGSNVCSYKGFFCDNPPDNSSAITVASIDFNGFQLSASSIDGFIDQLPDLAIFHANSNNFGGNVPSSIANLKYLYEFDISNNRFTGSFPTVVLQMPGLTFLDLRFNLFSGSVPPQIFNQNLDVLFINDNGFTEDLPDTNSETHILYLTLANNKFNGPIPRNILKSMSELTEVLFLNNKFTGCLPYEVGYLKNAVVFDAGGNQLTGQLPFSLNCLENVEQLNLAGNFFYGMVPEMVCTLENLANFSLSDNYFTHVGPWCRDLIERGVLDVRNNCIPRMPFQRSFKECASFFAQRRYMFCPRVSFHSFVPCRFPHFPHGSFNPVMAPSP